MESSKIKNIIIVILLTVNMFFLVIFLIGHTESGKLERQAKEDIVSIFAAAGVSLDISKIPGNISLGYYKLARDTGGEKLIAETLLGAKDMVSEGGNIYRYANVLGEAVFRPSGEFEVYFTSGKQFEDASPKALVAYLKNMGFAANIKNVATEASGGESYVFGLEYAGLRIFNASVVMRFEAGKLVSVSGRRPASAPQYSDSAIMNVSGALISFINGIRDIDPSCREIRNVSAGYLINEHAAGSFEMLPVWRIEANSGGYYVNALNGKISAIID